MYLMCGFEPLSPERILSGTNGPSVPREITESRDAEAMNEEFKALRSSALDALSVAQASQELHYNEGRLNVEFEEGDRVLINPHSLRMVKDIDGIGRKLTARFDGPFEISEKLGPVTYRLRLPASYGIHPVLNIAHLQPYRESPDELGARTTKHFNRADFEDEPEYEVERIVGEFWEDAALTPAQRKQGRKPRRIQKYIVKWVGYEDEEDYLDRKALNNAIEPLRKWETRDKSKDKEMGYRMYDPRKTPVGEKPKVVPAPLRKRIPRNPVATKERVVTRSKVERGQAAQTPGAKATRTRTTR